MGTLGGTGEKERAAELMTRITIVPDIPFSCLKVGGKIKSRSVVIFGTGHMMRALTVTANEGFVRAAKNQVHLQKISNLNDSIFIFTIIHCHLILLSHIYIYRENCVMV